MSRRYLIVLLGLATAVVIALIGRGGIFHYVTSIYILGIALGLSIIVWFVALLRKREAKYVVSGIVLIGVLQLASIPLGTGINEWDVSRAKTWCEKRINEGSRLPQGVRIKKDYGQGPALAMYDPAQNYCTVVDRTMLMGGWAYDESTGKWTHWD
jgi:hypothetical protein